jgi:hypothetical protein
MEEAALKNQLARMAKLPGNNLCADCCSKSA